MPSIAESALPGYDVQSWFALNAPPKTPTAMVAKLNDEVNEILASKEVQERLAELGAVATTMSPAEYGAFIDAEIKKCAPVVKRRVRTETR